MDDITRLLKEGKGIPMGIQQAPAAGYDPSLPIENAVTINLDGQQMIVGGVNQVEVIAREVLPQCLEMTHDPDPDMHIGIAAEMAVDCALALKRALATKMAAEAKKSAEDYLGG